MTLPAAVERLLLDVVADGFVVYCCGNRRAPTALAASYEWEHCVDLVTIRNFDRITAARVPRRGRVDVFAPELVVWAYEGPAECTLRALLTLVHPTAPRCPHRRLSGAAVPACAAARAAPDDHPASLAGPGWGTSGSIDQVVAPGCG